MLNKWFHTAYRNNITQYNIVVCYTYCTFVQLAKLARIQQQMTGVGLSHALPDIATYAVYTGCAINVSVAGVIVQRPRMKIDSSLGCFYWPAVPIQCSACKLLGKPSHCFSKAERIGCVRHLSHLKVKRLIL